MICVWRKVLGLSFAQSFDIVDRKTTCHPMALTSELSITKESKLQNSWKYVHEIIILAMMLYGLLHDVWKICLID